MQIGILFERRAVRGGSKVFRAVMTALLSVDWTFEDGDLWQATICVETKRSIFIFVRPSPICKVVYMPIRIESCYIRLLLFGVIRFDLSPERILCSLYRVTLSNSFFHLLVKLYRIVFAVKVAIFVHMNIWAHFRLAYSEVIVLAWLWGTMEVTMKCTRSFWVDRLNIMQPLNA